MLLFRSLLNMPSVSNRKVTWSDEDHATLLPFLQRFQRHLLRTAGEEDCCLRTVISAAEEHVQSEWDENTLEAIPDISKVCTEYTCLADTYSSGCAFYSQSLFHYFSNNRYLGLSPEQSDKIMEKETNLKSSDIYPVLKYHFWEELEILAEMDTKQGLKPAKLQRAAPIFYRSLSEDEQQRVETIAKEWKANGPIIPVQIEYVFL